DTEGKTMIRFTSINLGLAVHSKHYSRGLEPRIGIAPKRPVQTLPVGTSWKGPNLGGVSPWKPQRSNDEYHPGDICLRVAAGYLCSKHRTESRRFLSQRWPRRSRY